VLVVVVVLLAYSIFVGRALSRDVLYVQKKLTLLINKGKSALTISCCRNPGQVIVLRERR
jgi:hypothetical protein